MSQPHTPNGQTHGAAELGTAATARAPSWRATPELDLYESADALLVLLNVPGADAESIEVQALGNELHVRAEQGASTTHTDVARALFERHFELPVDVDPASATAELRDGVLEIRLQKSAAARRVKIPVSAN